MAHTITLLEDHILHVIAGGQVSKQDFEQGTLERLEFVRTHMQGEYVVIYDLSHANLAFLDLQVTQWSAKVDRNMVCVLIVSQQMLTTIGFRMLSKVLNGGLELCVTFEEALDRARAIISERLPVEV